MAHDDYKVFVVADAELVGMPLATNILPQGSTYSLGFSSMQKILLETKKP